MKLKILFSILLISLVVKAQAPPAVDPDLAAALSASEETTSAPAVTPAPEIVPDIVPVTDLPMPPPVVAPTKEKVSAPSPKIPVAKAAAPAPTKTANVYQILIPNKKQHELTVFVDAYNTTANDKLDDSIQYSRSIVISGVSYNYGIAQNHALGFDFNYFGSILRQTSSSGEVSEKSKGFMNPVLHYRGLFNFSKASLFTELGYSFRLEKEVRKGPDADGNFESNAAIGQNKFLITLGGYAPVGNDFILGALINYARNQDGEHTIRVGGMDDTTIKISAGDQMLTSVFLQVDNDYRPNISFGLLKSFSQLSTVGAGVESWSPNFDFLTASANAQIQTDTNIFFIPELTFMSAMKNDYYEKYDTFIFTGKLRFLF